VRDHAQDALVLGTALDRLRADPLAYWTPASDEQRRVVEELGRGEILFGGANKAGKTDIAKAFVALARGKRDLGGILLPAVPQPSAWVVSSLDFTQQLLSVQPKFMRAVGDWPHKPRRDGEVLRNLRIKYEGCRSDDPDDWSLITFVSAKNLQAGVGFRGNGYLCDEPPPMWLLNELRKMGDAGSLVIGVIAATFLKRSQWQPLRADYPDPRRNEGKWVGRFLRLRAPAFNPDDLDDTSVGNRFLTRADKEDLLAKYANLPESERMARLLGLEMDTSGSNPLRAVLDEMQRQHDQARDGEVIEWKVAREVPTRAGKQLVTETVEVESWEDGPRPGHLYRIWIDTSGGIADGLHDPGMVQVGDISDGVQVARYEGFLGEYGLGVLGGGLSKKWHDAEVWVGTTGGYGDTCLSGLRAVGCRNVHTRQVKGGDGVIDRTDIGFKETEATRTEGFGALLEAFKAAQMGSPYLTIRSRDDLAQLIDLQVDDKGRIIRVPGVHHGESAVLLGRFAVACSPEKRRQFIPPQAQRRAPSPGDLLRRQAGERVPIRRGNGTRLMPRQRLKWRAR
jgi:hypothetical protein